MVLVPDLVPLSAFWPFICWSVPHNCGLTPYGSCWGNTRVQSRTNEGFQTLTRSGIPTIIPSFHRRAIKDRRDPRLVKFYCSLFSLSNIILVWPSGRKIPPTTIHVKGYKPGPACVKIFETLMVSASEILLAYCPGYTRLPF